MNMVDSVTDCNKREGLWQLSQSLSVRAFDNVAGLHLLIAKLLVHFHFLTKHQRFLVWITFFSFFTCFHYKLPPYCIRLNGFYLAVKLSSVIYNRRPITLSHLHMLTTKPNGCVSQPFTSSPAPPVIRIFCSDVRGNTLEMSCVLSSMSLN